MVRRLRNANYACNHAVCTGNTYTGQIYDYCWYCCDAGNDGRKNHLDICCTVAKHTLLIAAYKQTSPVCNATDVRPRINRIRCTADGACLGGSVGWVTVHTDRNGLPGEPRFNPRYAGRFRVRISGAHALRLISRAGKEGSTVSSIICDCWLILS